MKLDVNKAVRNLRHNDDFIKVMALVHEACMWDVIKGKGNEHITHEELNGKRSVWAGLRSTMKFDADTLHAIEHFKYTKHED